uniref:Translocon-associated protein subunit beta n=1 Tax=Panagrolaimus davidi TaxID=227884 RepID=A0A914PSJ9_9BILA
MRLIFISLLFVLASAEDAEFVTKPVLNTARLLVSKQSLSQYAVENMDYVIQYDIFNIGDQPAVQVVLDDRNSFPTQSFEIVKGLLQVRWERIAPGENVTHSITLRPRNYGVFNYTAAAASYFPNENAKEVRVVYSTAPGEGYIYRLKDYERRFSSKVGVWIVYLGAAAATIFLPYFLWNKIQTEYPATTVRKQK